MKIMDEKRPSIVALSLFYLSTEIGFDGVTNIT